MIAPVKMAITADNQTGAAFKAVEAGIAEMRKAARSTTSAMATMRGAARDNLQSQTALASMYGQTSRAAEAAAGSTDRYARMMKLAAGATASFLTYRALASAASFGDRMIRDMDMILDMSERYGLATESLSQYRYVAEMSGTDFEQLAAAIKYSQRAVSEARSENSAAARELKALGLSVRDLRAMTPEEAFEAIGAAIHRLPTEFDRTNASMKLFGRSGTELIPMFKDGAAGVRELREEADRLGLTLERVAAEKAALAADSVDRLRTSWKRLAQELLTEVTPSLTKVADQLTFEVEFERAKQWMNSLAKEERAAYEDLFKSPARFFAGNEHYQPLLDAYRAALRQMREESKRAGAGLWDDILQGAVDASQSRKLDEVIGTYDEIQRAGRELRESMKSGGVANISFGLSAEDLANLRAAADQYERVTEALKEAAHLEWIASQIGPSDMQAREEAEAAVRAEAAAMKQRVLEYQQLKRESTLTWRLMSAGIEDVTYQLSNNMAMALTGIRTQLIEVADLARNLLGLAIRLGLNFLGGELLSSIFKTGSGLGNVPGLQGPTPSGLPLGTKALAPIPAGGSVRSVTIENVNIRGVLDPTDKMAVRRVVTAIFDEMETVAGHVGPRGAAA